MKLVIGNDELTITVKDSEKLTQALKELRTRTREIDVARDWMMEDPLNRTGMGVGFDCLSMEIEIRRAANKVFECLRFNDGEESDKDILKRLGVSSVED